jgi:hypothetical protein
MKYESPITCHSKDMANVKVFEKWVKFQGQGLKVTNYGTIFNQTRCVMKHKCPHTRQIPEVAKVKILKFTAPI